MAMQRTTSPPQRHLRKGSAPPQQQQQQRGTSRLLVTVNVLGSAGPIRFVAREEDPVAAVIATALRLYAREGRLPVLGTVHDNFLLYLANAGSDALRPMETIGSLGSRNFMMCKKPATTEELRIPNKKSFFVGWKAWINKSVSSH